jgi:hypothetical protein
MGWKDKLVDMGLVEREAPKEDEDSLTADDTPVAQPKARMIRPTVAVNAHASTAIPGQPGGFLVSNADAETVKALSEALNKSKLPGYEQFRIVFDTLASSGMPENVRYTTALSLLAATQKIDGKAVVASIADRLNLLANEEQSFKVDFAKATDEQVTQAEKKIEDIEAEVAKKKAEIQELENQRISLAQQAGEARVALERERASFIASLESVRTGLMQEQQRITVYVPSTPTK